LTSEHNCSILDTVNGAEFIRKVRKTGRRRGALVRFMATHGKGSHGRLYFGLRFTTVKDRNKDIGKGLLAAMLNQLGIAPGEF